MSKSKRKGKRFSSPPNESGASAIGANAGASSSAASAQLGQPTSIADELRSLGLDDESSWRA